jgi:hypothetical protein
MGVIADAIAFAFRFYETDGVPLSGVNEPQKADIIAIGPIIESAMGLSPQRAIVTAGDLPLRAGDKVLNVNAAAPLNIVALAAAGRAGVDFIFNVMATSANCTLLRTGADTFDGVTTLPLNAGTKTKITPYDDGVNNALGYWIGS